MASRAPETAGVGGNQVRGKTSDVKEALKVIKIGIDELVKNVTDEKELINADFEIKVDDFNGLWVYSHRLLPDIWYVFSKNNGYIKFLEQFNKKDKIEYPLIKSTTY